MKRNQFKHLAFVKLLIFLFASPPLVAGSFNLQQGATISGKVVDKTGVELPGASVVVLGTVTTGTITDVNGNFTIENLTSGDYTLEISSVGYEKITRNVTLGTRDLNLDVITLAESLLGLEEVIVTGVFDERSKFESSIAISTLKSKEIELETPVSASDLLKKIPGVFVNSALGEVRNIVYSRGVSAGSEEANSGNVFISLQEDGLPVTNVTWDNYGPDYFLRPDLTLGRLEAVRGGTASITAVNAPGGVFNYVSKEGSEEFAGQVNLKYGLQSEKFNYARTDFNVGGPLGNSTFYNVGGFYRYDEGNRYPGYPYNNGGQIKANITKFFDGGSIKFYVKYLNDRNLWYEFLPTSNFEKPEVSSGFSNRDALLIPKVNVPEVAINNNDNILRNFDPSDGIFNRDFAAGVSFELGLGEGWSVKNNLKYSTKYREWNSSGFVNVGAIDNVGFTHIFANTANLPDGNLNFFGPDNTSAIVNISDGVFSVVGNSTLPGSSVLANGVVTELALHYEHDVAELMDQFVITKKFDNMTFNLGTYAGVTSMTGLEGFPAAAFRALQPDGELIQVEFVDDRTNTTYQITDPSTGLFSIGRTGFSQFDGTYSQYAAFLGHTWNITENIVFDWGIRNEWARMDGRNSLRVGVADELDADGKLALTEGGRDGDPLTRYDLVGGVADPVFYDKTLSTFSFSGGLSVKISDNQLIYGRFSQGKKAPDLRAYFSRGDQELLNFYDPADNVQTVNQIELGYKNKGIKHNLIVTPFFSVLSGIGGNPIFQLSNGDYFSPPALNNRYKTFGVEIEGEYLFTDEFSVNGNITVQTSKATKIEIYNQVDNTTRTGLEVIDQFSGNTTDNIPPVLLTITPKYGKGKFLGLLTWKYLSEREANLQNTFKLTAASQFDLSLSYELSKNFSVLYNVNNIFNSEAVLSWVAPSSSADPFNRQGFTRENLEISEINGWPFGTVMLPPRSHFFTLAFKF